MIWTLYHAHSFQLLFIYWWRGSSLEKYGIYNTFSRNNEYLLTFLIEKTLRNTVLFSFWRLVGVEQNQDRSETTKLRKILNIWYVLRYNNKHAHYSNTSYYNEFWKCLLVYIFNLIVIMELTLQKNKGCSFSLLPKGSKTLR